MTILIGILIFIAGSFCGVLFSCLFFVARDLDAIETYARENLERMP
jgi:hypothetical protein